MRCTDVCERMIILYSKKGCPVSSNEAAIKRDYLSETLN